MSSVHYYGLRDKPSPHRADVKYEVRPWLGFSLADVKMIETAVIKHLTR
ncbi:phage virion morphogenesis protein [Serratia ureilytica]|nr:phage virion morphogenesis protein [Serratia ureilytica]